MKFNVQGVRVTTQTNVTTEALDCQVEITKAAVMKWTGCAAVIDGDPTGWYDYVDEALLAGAPHSLSASSDDRGPQTTVTTESYEWDGFPQVDVI